MPPKRRANLTRKKSVTKDPTLLAAKDKAEADRDAVNWTSNAEGGAAGELGELEEDSAAETPEPASKRGRMEGVSEAQRFGAILFFFISLDAPPPEEWDGAGGSVSFIRKKMDLPADAARSVRGHMEKIWTMLLNGEDPTYHRLSGGGRPLLLTDADEQIAISMVVSGLGLRIATDKVNAHRTKNQRPPVGLTTIWACTQAFTRCKRRQSQNNDPAGDLWKTCSLAQAEQFQTELRKHYIHLSQIVFWDEHHE